MPAIRCLRPMANIGPDKKSVARGEEIDVDEKQARYLVGRGAAEYVNKAPMKPSGPLDVTNDGAALVKKTNKK